MWGLLSSLIKFTHSMRLLSITMLVCLCLVVAPMIFGCETSDDTDFLKSAELAKTSRRHLLLAFIGTDWSISSLKLDREVFDQSEFADNSKYDFLLCKLHFYQTIERAPEIARQNQELAEKYKIEQFPTVVILDPDGSELGRIGYVAGGVEKFGAAVNALIAKPIH